MFSIRKGLSLPISGKPSQTVSHTVQPKTVAVIGYDYVGMKPTMLVGEGDVVKKGQPIFEDKKCLGVVYTAPQAGKIKAINRGAKRVFESIEIECSGSDQIKFDALQGALHQQGKEKVTELLLKSGDWTAIRVRPYSKVANPKSTPKAVFVNAMDTNPLAADPRVILEPQVASFSDGLDVLSNLTEGKVFVCSDSNYPLEATAKPSSDKVVFEKFKGKHPAGLVGTHIHKLCPVGQEVEAWHLNYQDVIAIGHLAKTGEIMSERTVSVAGPLVSKPSLVKTCVGANLSEVIGKLNGDVKPRVISGSVFNGRHGDSHLTYLGRYHLRVTVIEESNKRFVLGWKLPGFERFSVKKIYAGAMFPWKKFAMTSLENGSKRAIVPIGAYEGVMPLDIEATYLLRSLVSDDLEKSVELGALELDEEDLALCSFVCPGKHDFGKHLRNILTTVEREG